MLQFRGLYPLESQSGAYLPSISGLQRDHELEFCFRGINQLREPRLLLIFRLQTDVLVLFVNALNQNSVQMYEPKAGRRGRAPSFQARLFLGPRQRVQPHEPPGAPRHGQGGRAEPLAPAKRRPS